MTQERQVSGRLTVSLAKALQGMASVSEMAVCVSQMFSDIDAALAPILGARGVAALFTRSVHLCARQHAWLAVGSDVSSAVLDVSALHAAVSAQEPEEARAGSLALLQDFLQLLESLIGPALSERLLYSVWPDRPDHSNVQDAPK